MLSKSYSWKFQKKYLRSNLRILRASSVCKLGVVLGLPKCDILIKRNKVNVFPSACKTWIGCISLHYYSNFKPLSPCLHVVDTYILGNIILSGLDGDVFSWVHMLHIMYTYGFRFKPPQTVTARWDRGVIYKHWSKYSKCPSFFLCSLPLSFWLLCLHQVK